MAETNTIPDDLRTDAPPEDAEVQLLAWAVDMHGIGIRKPDPEPRWMIVQWRPDYPGGKPFWCWSVPGRSAEVRILGWKALSAMDQHGRWGSQFARPVVEDGANS